MKWVSLGKNKVLECEGFYISFVAHNQGILAGTSLDAPHEGETAICSRETFKLMINPYFILNGDFREQLGALAPKGLKAVLSFYFAQPTEIRSEFSNLADSLDEVMSQVETLQ